LILFIQAVFVRNFAIVKQLESKAINSKVSVVIPTYNCDRYIAEAIESVLHQTYTNYEILVVDDGSTDKTRQSLEPYIGKICYIYQENQGVSAARNRGIKEAKGEFIAFLDADDYFLLPSKLADQVACFKQYPKLGIVHSGWKKVNHYGEAILDIERWYDSPTLDLKTWVSQQPALPSAMMFRKEWLERVGDFDVNLTHLEDVDLAIRLAFEGCQATWLKKITVAYRQHDNSAVAQGTVQQAKSTILVLNKVFSRLDLPKDLRQIENSVRIGNLSWVAFCLYKNQQFDAMADYLKQSLNYIDRKNKNIVLLWIEMFNTFSRNFYGQFLEIHEITVLPQWKKLIADVLNFQPRNDIYRINSLNKDNKNDLEEIKSISNILAQNTTIFHYPQKLKFNLSLLSNFGEHRSGWSYAINSLKCLQNDSGILVEPFVENDFCWWLKKPFKKPWIGFVHNPQNMPKWFKYNQSPQALFSSKLWKESLESCKGLFCLSQYHKLWLQEQMGFDIPIASLIHPTETPNIKFSMQRFLANCDRKIVQVGWWLRKLHSIYYLPVNRLRKSMLKLNKYYINEMFEMERKEFNIRPNLNDVEIIDRLPEAEYDELLSKNIVYLDLYDSSANNAIIECIVRNTPVLVNPLPAVIEYLGKDYPLYFNSHNEAARKAEDFSLIQETHEYLKSHPIKEKLTAEYFLKSFAESKIYQNLTV